jgi:AAA domain
LPSLANHQSNEFTKLLIEGDSKSGKTGALSSLVKAGYSLRILDYDNGLDVLRQYVQRDCPDALGKVEYRTLRDKRRTTPAGTVVDGQPKAFVDGVRMLDRWKYKFNGEDVDFGVPAEWGPNVILVIDSLTFLSDAAWDWREPLVPRSRDGKYDPRAVYGDAQRAVEDVLAVITSESFRTNVIVISHVKYSENPDGTKKGYPNSVGSALGPLILRYFNNVVRFTNKGGKRKIETEASAMFDLANARPFKMPKELDIENGLAEFFSILRDQKGK